MLQCIESHARRTVPSLAPSASAWHVASHDEAHRSRCRTDASDQPPSPTNCRFSTARSSARRRTGLQEAQSNVQKIELCHTVQAIVNQPRHAAHSTAATSACDGRQGMHHLPGTRPRTDPVWVRLPRRRGAGTRGMPHRGSNARREGWQLLRMADVRNVQAGFHRRDEAWAAAREVARCAESA